MKKSTSSLKALLLSSIFYCSAIFLNAQGSPIVHGVNAKRTNNFGRQARKYKWDVGVSTGVSNYLGDMGGNELTRRDFVSDMKLQETRMDAGVFTRYRINHLFYVQGNLGWVRIQGNDKLSSNPARNARNLNFRNDLVELTAQAQFVFYEVNDLGHTYRYNNNFRAYVGLGSGAAYHSPKAELNGEWIALRPLETEGIKYSKVAAVIPATLGFYFTINRYFRVGWNLTWRTTFTDYLDDVSKTYIDPSMLHSPMAVQLANRTNELTTVSPAFAENFTPGDKRGDPTHNDSYMTSNIDMSYVLRGHTGAKYGWIKDRHPDKFLGIQRKVRVHW